MMLSARAHAAPGCGARRAQHCGRPIGQRAAAARPLPARPARRACLQAQARSGSYSSQPSIPDRVLAAVPYLLPLLHSFQYGRFLLYTSPMLRQAVSPLFPLLQAYNSVPFAHMIAFFGIYIGIVNNSSIKRFVRFNAMQAMLLDVVLVLPSLIEQLITLPRSGPGLEAYIWCNNAIWIGMAAAVVFGVVFSLLGQTARIPLVGDAADQQLR
jgi:uncharacterized membrane protein